MKIPALCLPLVPLLGHAATIDDLWITEVLPSTGQVEITNVGDGPVVASTLPFCHRFQYSDTIPSGTSFAVGESKVFTLNFSNAADSDLWLYRVGGGFGSASNIITGLKWGPTAGIGRTGIATTAGKWDGVGLPVPEAGMALHLVAPDPTKSTSWSVGEADLGSHSFPLDSLALQLNEGMIDLSWEGGAPPFRVETSTGLGSWENLTGLLNVRSHPVVQETSEDRRFFRVTDQAVLEESAEYRITFTSLWTTDRFATVPGRAHFSGLIGGTHNSSVFFWRPGVDASTGIENMAETGSKTALTNEVQAAVTAGSAGQVLSGGGLGFAPSQTTLDFTANRSHPLITLTSMIAPSPDWFVGIRDQSLLQENEDWLESLTIDLVAYDAGTEEGDSFSLNNSATTPQEVVFRIETTDDEFDPSFLPASGPVGDPIPIARLVIERIIE